MADDTRNDDESVVGLDDGLTDQQREGARLAAAGWKGTDIADSLGVRQETVSRWRKLPTYRAAIEGHLADSRNATAGRMADLVEHALDVIEEQMDYKHDRSIKLRAAIALLQLSGLGRAMAAAQSPRSGQTVAAAGGD